MNHREHREAVSTGKTLVRRTCGIALAAFAAVAMYTRATAFTVPAADTVVVRLDTTKGAIVIAVHRDWAPHGADRFLELVNARYFDDSRFFRVVKGQWAQFGIAADPNVATAWRTRTIPDDPRGQSVTRGKVAFAFAVPNGRTTQIYVSLRDNSYQDDQGFVPFGEVVQGMDVADALNSEYGETSGGGIRAGKQQALFDGGNAYLDRRYPRLDRIVRAVVVPARQPQHRAALVVEDVMGAHTQ
jgi:peptidyl-prolyl cis-trans isomerase A (cyclophilin A)